MDKAQVKRVCIDDFALKKRHTYGTIMVDLDTHQVVDLIRSRNGEEVTSWLKTFPNLEIVSRDGSITYAHSIAGAHPNAIQISDRFHLLQNLTKYCTEFFKSIIKTNVKIPVKTSKKAPLMNANNLNIPFTKKVKIANGLMDTGYTFHQIAKALQMDIRTVKKVLSMSLSEQEEYLISTMKISHEHKKLQKEKQICEARQLYKQGNSKRSIARQLGLDRRTISKYLNPETTGMHASLGQTRTSMLDPYAEEIKQYVTNRYTSVQIGAILRKKGYKGSTSTVRHYISKLKESFFEDPQLLHDTEFEFVKRKEIIALLFCSEKTKIKLSEEQIKEIYKLHSKIESVTNLVNDFRDILRQKRNDALQSWIERATALDIQPLNSFINGIERDLTAVKNAIAYEYNNGLAEGKINKLKLIKRTMYGRCLFDLLRNKILLLEYEKEVLFN
ncbi:MULTISPECIES: ISL3 family transposase [Bacillus]|uniref:ISL3 family transposase n=1 Tax=Bacillus TaxID=1386 RepID=UPI00114551AB|nr:MULTISPECIES: ISL3 family transposase [Bacillus]